MIVDSAFCDLNLMAVDIAIVKFFFFLYRLLLERNSFTIIHNKTNNPNNKSYNLK